MKRDPGFAEALELLGTITPCAGAPGQPGDRRAAPDPEAAGSGGSIQISPAAWPSSGNAGGCMRRTGTGPRVGLSRFSNAAARPDLAGARKHRLKRVRARCASSRPAGADRHYGDASAGFAAGLTVPGSLEGYHGKLVLGDLHVAVEPLDELTTAHTWVSPVRPPSIQKRSAPDHCRNWSITAGTHRSRRDPITPPRSAPVHTRRRPPTTVPEVGPGPGPPPCRRVLFGMGSTQFRRACPPISDFPTSPVHREPFQQSPVERPPCRADFSFLEPNSPSAPPLAPLAPAFRFRQGFPSICTSLSPSAPGL